MITVIGKQDLETIRYKTNRKIDALLKDTWLDWDTARDFAHKQNQMQKNPYKLQQLVGTIEHEIAHRKLVYGNDKKQA